MATSCESRAHHRACPLRGQIANDVQSKVAGVPGVADVASSTPK